MTEKLEPQVPHEINDITTDNIAALAQLFPSVIKDGQVDFEALQTELQKEPIQFADPKEVFGLTWTGKREAIQTAKEDTINRTLNFSPEDSKKPDSTKNLYIEGDNLEVLKLLRQNYYGAVKMIHIDPPYNTGKDFVYNDNFHMTKEEKKDSDKAEGTVDEDGERLQVNSKEGNKRYHANWLNMIYPRLKLARELLAEDGVIFISMDDNEQCNLKKVCDEVFGEHNFVAQIIWKKRATPPNDRSIGRIHEYILCYCKNIAALDLGLLPRDSKSKERYSNPDNDERGPWVASDLSANGKGGRMSVTCVYPIIHPVTNVAHEPPEGKYWLFNKDKMQIFLQEGRIGFRENSGSPFLKRYFSEVRQGVTMPTILTEFGFSSNSTIETDHIFENKGVFEYAKPTTLIKALLQIGSKNTDLILDFFSGSATTAHAVMKLNAEDGGNRKFICVQIPEETDEKSEAYKAGYKNICEIGKERIRRAGVKIKTEVEEANAQLKMGENPKKVPDIGFKVFKVDDTNIRWNKVEQGDDDMSFEDLTHTPDLADFVMGAKDVDVVYELVLRQRNIPLSLPLQTLTHIGERTYLYGGTLLVCLENEITTELTENISMVSPLPSKFIFRDSSFGLNIEAKRFTFDYFKKQVDKNTDGTEKDYRVEFI